MGIISKARDSIAAFDNSRGNVLDRLRAGINELDRKVELPQAKKSISFQGRWDQYDDFGGVQIIPFNAVRSYFEAWNVFRCISLIAKCTATLPFKQRNQAGEDVLNSPHLRLITNKANQYYSGAKFNQAMITYKLIYGFALAPLVGTKQRPQELWALNSRGVDIIEDENNVLEPIKEFRYNKPNGGTHTFLPDEAIYMWEFNPNYTFRGMSTVSVGKNVIDAQTLSENWNKYLLINGGKPSAVLIPDESLDDSQWKRLKKAIRQKWQGPENAGEVFVSPEGMKVQIVQLTPADMDWIESQKISLRKVAAIFGVPPEMLGDGENKTYSNQKEARKGFYEETIVPTGQNYAQDLSHFFWEDGVNEFYVDIKSIPALQVSAMEKVNALKGESRLTDNEWRKMMDLPEMKGDAANILWKPINLVPAKDQLLTGNGADGDDTK